MRRRRSSLALARSVAELILERETVSRALMRTRAEMLRARIAAAEREHALPTSFDSWRAPADVQADIETAEASARSAKTEPEAAAARAPKTSSTKAQPLVSVPDDFDIKMMDVLAGGVMDIDAGSVKPGGNGIKREAGAQSRAEDVAGLNADDANGDGSINVVFKLGHDSAHSKSADLLEGESVLSPCLPPSGPSSPAASPRKRQRQQKSPRPRSGSSSTALGSDAKADVDGNGATDGGDASASLAAARGRGRGRGRGRARASAQTARQPGTSPRTGCATLPPPPANAAMTLHQAPAAFAAAAAGALGLGAMADHALGLSFHSAAMDQGLLPQHPQTLADLSGPHASATSSALAPAAAVPLPLPMAPVPLMYPHVQPPPRALAQRPAPTQSPSMIAHPELGLHLSMNMTFQPSPPTRPPMLPPQSPLPPQQSPAQPTVPDRPPSSLLHHPQPSPHQRTLEVPLSLQAHASPLVLPNNPASPGPNGASGSLPAGLLPSSPVEAQRA